MDLATIVGMVLGFSLMVWAILLGGSLMIFVDIPSVAIVVGGMLCVTMTHFSLGQFLSIFAIMKKTIFVKIPPTNQLIQQMVNYAAINRRDGALALEQEISKTHNAFIKKGLQMLVDGQEQDNIKNLMELEIQSLEERHAQGKKILEFMGASSPAMGMIGTLIGLVQMLRNLSSPESLGAGMAVALITTFYGAVLSNMIFIPLAGKLGLYSKKEILTMSMTIEGLCAISQGENPTVVKEKMQAYLAPKQREAVKAAV